MPPLILEKPFAKIIDNVDDFFCGNDYFLKVEAHYVSDQEPADEGVSPFRVELYQSDKKGLVKVFTAQSEQVGTLVFNIAAIAESVSRNTAIEVVSVYFDEEFQGEGLGLFCYELLSEHYDVISDSQQSVDGAVFWKNKVSVSEKLNVYVILDYEGEATIVHSGSTGEPVIYTGDLSLSDNLIWSAATFKAQERSSQREISCEVDGDNEYTRLIAKRIIT